MSKTQVKIRIKRGELKGHRFLQIIFKRNTLTRAVATIWKIKSEKNGGDHYWKASYYGMDTGCQINFRGITRREAVSGLRVSVFAARNPQVLEVESRFNSCQ